MFQENKIGKKFICSYSSECNDYDKKLFDCCVNKPPTAKDIEAVLIKARIIVNSV